MREAVAMLVLLLAGCVSPAAETLGETPAPARLAASLLESDAGCRSFCEPNVAVLPTGEWFVLGDRLMRSTDNGSNWDEVALPPSPVPAGFQADSLVQSAPEGVLFFSALVASCSVVSCVLEGIQVARSSDGGASWSSTFLSLPGHANGFGADRQWLAFGPAGLVCLHFQYVGVLTLAGPLNTGPELRVSCSTDGGATFPDPVSASGVVESGVINGRGLFGTEGRLLIPYFRLEGQDSRLFLAVSEDGGRTFEQVAVDGAAGDYFPALALDTQGALHVLWRDREQAVAYATSADLRTWSAPRVVSEPGEKTPTSPWIEARGDGVLAAWFVAESEASNRLVAWDGAQTTTLATNLTNGAPRPAATDFAHLTAATDGRGLVVFGDLERAETRLAVVG